MLSEYREMLDEQEAFAVNPYRLHERAMILAAKLGIDDAKMEADFRERMRQEAEERRRESFTE